MENSMMWTGAGWFGGIFMVLFWVIILIGIVFLVDWLKNSAKTGGRQSSHAPESALDILKRRYASGEITREQYESMRRDLDL